MQLIGDRITQRMEQFTKIENEITTQLAAVSNMSTSNTATSLAASLGTVAKVSTAGGGGKSMMQGDAIREEIETHLHHLRSFLVGAINWAYENERWVGQKGDEVREFRWMFCEEGGS
jgi:hypothetical protein